MTLMSRTLRAGAAIGAAATICVTMAAPASAANPPQRAGYIGAFAGTASQWNAAYGTIGPLADVYQPTLIGLKTDAEFLRWNYCTAGRGKPQGIGEYGLGVCVAKGTFTEPDRANTLAADAAYLARAFPHLLMWQYWWSTISGATGPCDKWKFPVSSPTLREWKAIEAGTAPS